MGYKPEGIDFLVAYFPLKDPDLFLITPIELK